MSKPTGLEAAKAIHGDELPECDQCGAILGTNGGCIQCLYSYESHLRELECRE